MPVLESQHNYEELKQLERTRQCVCGANLVLCWGGNRFNEYILRCFKDIEHDVLARPYQPSPFAIPGYNLGHISQRRRNQLEKQLETRQPGAGKLMEFHGAVLNRQQADTIVNTLWPGAPAVEKAKAAMICVQYELNPLMKHLFIIPFGQGEKAAWAVVLGIQANRLIAHRAGDFSYLDDTPRLMSEAEQVTILGEVDKSNLWAITKLRDSKGNVAQGYGNWPKDKAPQGVDKGNSKANMAMLRSERQGMDRLFAGKLPSGVDVIDAQYVQVSEPGDAVQLKADKDTGEISEATATVKPEAPPAETAGDKQAFDGLTSATPSSNPASPVKAPGTEDDFLSQVNVGLTAIKKGQAWLVNWLKAEGVAIYPKFADTLEALTPEQQAKVLAKFKEPK